MITSRATVVSLCLGCVLAGSVLAGCGHSGTSSTMTSQEQKSFKGGPMTPEAKKLVADKMRQVQQRGGMKAGGPQPANAGR